LFCKIKSQQDCNNKASKLWEEMTLMHKHIQAIKLPKDTYLHEPNGYFQNNRSMDFLSKNNKLFFEITSLPNNNTDLNNEHRNFCTPSILKALKPLFSENKLCCRLIMFNVNKKFTKKQKGKNISKIISEYQIINHNPDVILNFVNKEKIINKVKDNLQQKVLNKLNSNNILQQYASYFLDTIDYKNVLEIINILFLCYIHYLIEGANSIGYEEIQTKLEILHREILSLCFDYNTHLKNIDDLSKSLKKSIENKSNKEQSNYYKPLDKAKDHKFILLINVCPIRNHYFDVQENEIKASLQENIINNFLNDKQCNPFEEISIAIFIQGYDNNSTYKGSETKFFRIIRDEAKWHLQNYTIEQHQNYLFLQEIYKSKLDFIKSNILGLISIFNDDSIPIGKYTDINITISNHNIAFYLNHATYGTTANDFLTMHDEYSNTLSCNESETTDVKNAIDALFKRIKRTSTNAELSEYIEHHKLSLQNNKLILTCTYPPIRNDSSNNRVMTDPKLNELLNKFMHIRILILFFAGFENNDVKQYLVTHHTNLLNELVSHN